MLRCLELGIRPSDLEYFDEGDIKDLLVERENDSAEYDVIATQEDFDKLGTNWYYRNVIVRVIG